MSDEVKKFASQKRVSLVAVDQIVSTTINFVILFSCMRLLSTSSFGVFAFVWGVISTFIIFSRSLFGTPIMLDSSDIDLQTSSINGSLLGAFTLGIFATTTILMLNAVQNANLKLDWVFLVVLLSPLFLLHDQFRFVFVAKAKPRIAILIDAILFAAVVISAIYMFKFKVIDFWLPGFLLFGFAAAALAAIRQISVTFDPKGLRELIIKDLHRRGLLLTDAFFVLFFGILSLFLLRLASGNEGVGLYSALALVFVPVTLVSVFMVFGLQKEVTRTRGNLLARHKIYLLLLCLSPLAWGAALSLVPNEIILVIFGETVNNGLAFVAVYALSTTMFLLLEMLNLFLKSDARFLKMLQVRIFSGVVLATLLVVAGHLNLSMSFLIGSFGIASSIAVIVTMILLSNRSNSCKSQQVF